MGFGASARLRRALRYVIALVIGAIVAAGLPAAQAVAAPDGDPGLVVVSSSGAGDTWYDAAGNSGAAVLTHGHVGCDAIDAQGTCVSGLWGRVADASWIWRTQQSNRAEPRATFTEEFEADATQAASPAVLDIAADNVFEARLNGEVVASGSAYTQGTTVAVDLTAGTNRFEVDVENLDNGFGPDRNPAGVAWAVIGS